MPPPLKRASERSKPSNGAKLTGKKPRATVKDDEIFRMLNDVEGEHDVEAAGGTKIAAANPGSDSNTISWTARPSQDPLDDLNLFDASTPPSISPAKSPEAAEDILVAPSPSAALSSAGNPPYDQHPTWSNSEGVRREPSANFAASPQPRGQTDFRRYSPNFGPVSLSPPQQLRGQNIYHARSQPSSLPSYTGRSPPGFPFQHHRRASVATNHGPRSMSGRAPLPHESQAHYYGLPHIDFASLGGPHNASSRVDDGSNVTFRRFETLDGSGDVATQSSTNVLITGRGTSIDVHAVQDDGLKLIGTLKNLPRRAIDAKIIRKGARNDVAASLRPLIAVTLHGPVTMELTGDPTSKNDQRFAHSAAEHPQVDPNSVPALKHFRTSVVVCSLAASAIVSPLFDSPIISSPAAMYSDVDENEPPPCPISLAVQGDRIVIAIGGRHGELYVYEIAQAAPPEQRPRYRCVGKLWTSLHPPQNGSQSAPLAQATFELDSEIGFSDAVPIFSLGDRWLATVPPSTSQFSLYGEAILLDPALAVPGLSVTLAPPPPPITCVVDAPGNGMLGRIARETGKGLVKSANWLGDQGRQLLRTYVIGESNPASLIPTNTNALQAVSQDHAHRFPPTHATHGSELATRVPVVAIYDLERLTRSTTLRTKNALEPVAVFQQPLGCSFLSFAPSGLHLLTINSNGDTQSLLDLKRLRHGRDSLLSTASFPLQGPCVREVTRFTRMTEATVVDVIWNPPGDHKLALLTDKGTLHVHNIPTIALTWPPTVTAAKQGAGARATLNGDLTTGQVSHDEPGPKGTLISALGGATSWLYQGRQSLNSNPYTTALSNFSVAPTVGAGARTARVAAVAAGKTIGDGVNFVRHHQDNKLHLLSQSQQAKGCSVEPGTAMWLTGSARGTIGVILSQSAAIYRVAATSRDARGGSKGMRSVSLRQVASFALPAGATAETRTTKGPVWESNRLLETVTGDRAKGDWHSCWQDKAQATDDFDLGREKVMWKSYAELATHSGYHKFHTDPRVSLSVYATDAEATRNVFGNDSEMSQRQALIDDATEDLAHQRRLHHVEDDHPWVFGLEIPSARVSTGTSPTRNAGIIIGENGEGDVIWSSGNDIMEDTTGGDGGYDLIEFADDRG